MENTAVNYGYGVTDKVVRALIEELLIARSPETTGLITALRGGSFTEAEREAVREILANELVEYGLGADDELNERGRLLEAAIDWLGHR